MVILAKAVLHILDFQGGEPVLSAQELALEDGIREFLTKHIEKTIHSQDAKTGKFYENSEFNTMLQAYLEEKSSFVEFSRQIAEILYKALAPCQDIQNTDLFVCQLVVDDVPHIALLKCVNHQGYVHQVNIMEDGIVATEVMNSSGLLPGSSQRMDEFAYINLDSGQVLIKAKKYSLDGNS